MTTDRLDSGLHCYVDTEGATRVLVVSDEVTQSLGGAEALLGRHLTSIKKELQEENKRKAKYGYASDIFRFVASHDTHRDCCGYRRPLLNHDGLVNDLCHPYVF